METITMLSTPRLSPDPTATRINAAINNEKMIRTQHIDDARHPIDYMSPCAAEESEPFTGKRTFTIEGPMELYLDANDRGVYKKSLLHVESGDINRVRDIVERVTSLRHPMRTIPLPTRSEPYGTTHQLVSQIKTTLLEQTSVSSEASAILTYWALSTWFMDTLPVAPCLVITGSSQEGDTVLRTLRTFCRHPLLMAGINGTSLKGIPWHLSPTLLIFEPNLRKGTTELISCSTRPGYLVGRTEKYQDYYCPKAIYVGQNQSMQSIPRHSAHVNATATPTVGLGSQRISEAIAQRFQNQLVNYRLGNLVNVHKSHFDAVHLPTETRTIANALGACIVDAPDLQEELIQLLP
jgi:hypothetical protein